MATSTFLGKKGIATALIVSLLMTSGIQTAAYAADENTLGQDRQQAQEMQDHLANLDGQLKDTMNKYNQLQAEINGAMQQDRQLQEEIEKTEQSIAEQQEKLKGRVKVMYENGEVSFWQVLFQATDFSDFIERFSLLTMIAENDKTMIEQLQADQQKLKDQQEALAAQQKARQDKQQELLLLEEELTKQYNEKAADLAKKQQEISAEEQQAMQAYSDYQGSVEPGTIIAGGNGTYAWPVPSTHNVTSPFGFRFGGAEFHKGIDIGTPVGTPFVAVADGVVLAAGSASGYGHWIVILHANNMISVYGHMYANGVGVSAGQHVKQGQVIGASGNDGVSTGPHLHFSMAKGSSASAMSYVNPMGYLQ